MRSAWTTLAAELAAAAGVLLLDVFDEGEASAEPAKGPVLDVDLKRRLWGVLATTWQVSGDVCWEDVVRFLSVPFG